ncbi:MAG TPA: alpha/beta fold hydrolase [Usitatibacteraceae bacterium]
MTTAQLPSFNSTIVRFMARHPIAPALRRGVQRVGMRLASAVAPRFAVRQAMDRFMTPPRFPRPEAEHALLDNATALDIATPLGDIRAWRFGEPTAPVILFSHGWGGRGAQFRSFVPALLDAGYQVILFDHIGHGQSAGRESSLVDFWRGLEAALKALDAQGLVLAGLVGHSLGAAAVASALRGMPPGQTQGLRAVLIAPPSSVIRYSKFFARYLGISERIRDAMQWRFEQRTGVAWQEFELPHSVDRIAAKALVIHDRDDRDVGIDSGLAIARAWPDARFHETRRLGHNRILRDREVIQHVVDFLGGRVEFLRPPASGERSPYREPAPLY